MSENEISDDVDQLIRVLPDVLANKIAAGEVVERPAAAVKELVENAIDAGASRIEVILAGSGTDLIQIVDDGCGMSPTDARLAFKRHATSKIRSIDDLERVRTLGFRGEAVASIAAVSRTSIRTKRRSDLSGLEIKVTGGVMESNGPVAAADGTTVSVRDLFFNVPARRKFLKAPTTELRRIVEVLEALSLSHPEISFVVSHDGKQLFNLTPSPAHEAIAGLRERIIALLGLRGGESLIEIGEDTSYISVSGFVGEPAMSRKSRGRQYLFVNGRSVRSRYLEHAVRSAYEQRLVDGEYPFFALFLDLDPSHVDVNVHPTKAEVKFADERGVYSVMRTIVARALSESDASPQLAQLENIPSPNWRFDGPAESSPATGFGSRRTNTKQAGDLSQLLYGSHGPGESTREAEGGLFMQRTQPVPIDIWQIDDKFLVVQLRQGLLLLDQNTAHERVLYERALESLKGGGGFSQQLLFPKSLEFGAVEFALVQTLATDLRTLGFDVEPFGGRSVLLRGVPTGVKEGAAESLLYEIVGQFREFEEESDSTRSRGDRLARALARKSAVKSGDVLSQAEMRGLVDQLLICENPWIGPAGNTAVVRIGVAELLRLLGR